MSHEEIAEIFQGAGRVDGAGLRKFMHLCVSALDQASGRAPSDVQALWPIEEKVEAAMEPAPPEERLLMVVLSLSALYYVLREFLL